ncbi:MAG TPA: acetoacetate decarboxylase family protein, partial [Polyangiales bacterium]
GRDLTLPMEIADCSLVLNAFSVDANVAQALLVGTGLTIARVLPGKAVLLLMGVAYRDNPLGDYNEAAILLSAYPPGEAKSSWISGALSSLAMGVPYYVYRMPVDQEFTTHAGRFLWGYPKYLADIDVKFEAERAHTRLTQDGQFVLSFEATAVNDGSSGTRLRDQTGMNITWRNGQLRRIPATLGGRGIAWRLGGVAPELGDHPLALQLRALGLPKRPLLSASSTSMQMRFGVPELLTAPAIDR